MPVWTKGWFYPIYYLEQASQIGTSAGVPESVGLYSRGLYGRDLAGGVAGGHTVIMQKELSPTTVRNVVPSPNGDIGVDYRLIYSENWPTQ